MFEVLSFINNKNVKNSVIFIKIASIAKKVESKKEKHLNKERSLKKFLHLQSEAFLASPHVYGCINKLPDC